MASAFAQVRSLATCGIVAAAAWVYCQPIFAHDRAVSLDIPAQPEEIIVTARKRNETLQSVPVTVNVVSQQELFNQRLDDLGDLTKSIPNINFSSDQAIRARLAIRGVGADTTGSQGPGVGFYIDGVYQPSTAILNVPFFDLERVEVLKGPQGTLYGRNALGGVINYVTPKPGNDFTASAQVDAANVDTYGAAGSIGGPIGNDRLFFRVSAQHRESDGAWKYDTSGDNVAPTDFDSVRGRLVYAATDRLEFDLSGSYYEFDGPALPVTAIPELQHLDERYLLNQPNTASSESAVANLVASYGFEALQLLSRTSYNDIRTNNDVDADFTPGQLLRAKIDGHFRVASEEIRLHSTGSGPVAWMVGAAYANERTDSGSLLAGPVIGPGAAFASAGDSEVEVGSAFTDLTYNATDRLELGAGVRYDSIDFKFDASNSIIRSGSTIPAGTFIETFKEEVWQPKFTARYKLSSVFTSFASAAKGFRQGGFNTQSAGTSAATYDGDFLWNYELGLKWRDSGGRASANISVFYIDWQRATGNAFLPTSSGTPNIGVTVFGSAESHGVEADVQLHVNDYFTLSGSVGTVHCEYTNVKSNAAPGIENGGMCVDSSKWNGRVGVDFEYPIGGWDASISANANVSAYGDTRIGVDVQDRDYRQVQDSYLLSGVSLGLRLSHWKIIAFADNLFDERYATLVRTREGIAAFGAQSDVAVLGQPRSYGVRVRYDYQNE